MKLFGIFALIGSAFGQEDAQQAPVEARLLISKKTDTKILAENVDMTFTYKIYNIGQSAALDVEFTEENFANDWSIVSGDAKTSWKSIEPDSSVTHEIVVKPSKAGAQNITSAVLNYRPSSDSEETVRSFSSDYGVANIIPENEFLRNHASHGIDWLIFLVLTIPSILFPYMLYNKSVTRFTKAKKN